MIPQHTINQIKEAANDDIVGIVEDYVKLKRAGHSYKGLCPFHEENTPSFSVTERKGMYKCFGCGEGGDAVDFLMKMEGYDFIECIRKLADRLGILIDEIENPRSKKKNHTPQRAVIPGIKEAKRHLRKSGEARLCFSKKDAAELQKQGKKNAVYLPAYRPAQVELLARYIEDAIIYPRGLNRRKFFIALKITARQNIGMKIAKHAGDQPVHWVQAIADHYGRTKKYRKKCLRIVAAYENAIKRAVETQRFTDIWTD